MLIRNIDSDEVRIFHVSCSNWESAVTANSPEDAASIAFKEVRDNLGKAMFIAPSIIVIDITNSCMNFDLDPNTTILYTPEVMANAGYHTLSKTYDVIIKNNPSENPIDEIES